VVKDNSYVKFVAFMCNQYDLKGNTMLVYAIIHEFTVKKNHFYNSYSYISNWLSISRQQITQIVNELIDLNLVMKPLDKNIGRVKLKALSLTPDKYTMLYEERFRRDPSLSYLTDKKFVICHPFMVNLLKLSSHELIIFSSIYNLNENGVFPDHDSLDYLRSWSSVTQRTYKGILKKLFEKGYLVYKKHLDGVERVSTITKNGDYW